MSQNSNKNSNANKSDGKEANRSEPDSKKLRDLQSNVVEKRKEIPKKIKELYNTHQNAAMEQLKAIGSLSATNEEANDHFRVPMSDIEYERTIDVSNRLIELNKRLDVLEKAKQIIDNS